MNKHSFMRHILTVLFMLLSCLVSSAQDLSIGLFGISDSIKGMQMSLLSNMSCTPFTGLQLSGVSNISMGVKGGVQLSALSNISSANMRGVQTGVYNYADTLNGVQIGLLNACVCHPKGVQVGLMNYSRDTVARKVGLVNINPNTSIDMAVYGGNSTKTNVALRFRNRSTYSILGVGSHFLGFDEDFSGAFFYRIGQYKQLSPRWSLSGDVGFYHVETFEKNSDTKPERLYSLQARVNADYCINSRLSAFASVGYGTTRYYDHNEVYRRRPILEAGLVMHYKRGGMPVRKFERWGMHHLPDSLYADDGEKHPWIAAAEAAGVNVFVHSFDRFILDADFAQTTLNTTRDNFKKGLVWDNDQFSTNLFAHPYHGGLYFNSARSNGLSFWESAPYALGGSLMWEFLGEIEPPAINDLIATSLGGMAIGEITHRVSRIVLNDKQRGTKRFLRELVHTAVNPIGGLNRIIRGDAWRVRNDGFLYHNFRQIPVELRMSAGARYVADEGATFRGEWNPYLNVLFNYGDAMDISQNEPYDFFTARVKFGLGGNQPLVSDVHLLGRLWGVNVHEGRNISTLFGFFQHFNYYDSEPVKNGSDRVPYRISEAAGFGPGLICRFENIGNLGELEQGIFLDGILLGGSMSDHYRWIDRDYNMGSGFSAKINTQMTFPNFGRFSLRADFYRIYTWKGYEEQDRYNGNPLFLNVQGDKGNAMLFVVSPTIEVFLGKAWCLEFAVSNYIRRTHYKYQEDVRSQTYEACLGLSLSL